MGAAHRKYTSRKAVTSTADLCAASSLRGHPSDADGRRRHADSRTTDVRARAAR